MDGMGPFSGGEQPSLLGEFMFASGSTPMRFQFAIQGGQPRAFARHWSMAAGPSGNPIMQSRARPLGSAITVS
jgi:hypothetical protein